MIIHIDLDAFFVSAERIEQPQYNHLPLLIINREHDITPDQSTTKGVVITASYEARRFGIQSTMNLQQARLRCPHAIILPARIDVYRKISLRVKHFLESHIPILEQVSIDEFYGDVSGWVNECDLESYLETLKEHLKSTLGLPVSIGAGPTRTFAKLATNLAKPFGIRIYHPQYMEDFLNKLSIKRIPGIGRKMQKQLHSYGIYSVAHVKEMQELMLSLGHNGKSIYERILGINDHYINPSKKRKQIGIGRTFSPFYERDKRNRKLYTLIRHLTYTITTEGINPTTYHFQIKYDDGSKREKSVSLKRPFSETLLKEIAFETILFLDALQTSLKITFLGISVSGFLTQKTTFSLLDHQKDLKNHQLLAANHYIRQRFGVDAIRWGGEYL